VGKGKRKRESEREGERGGGEKTREREKEGKKQSAGIKRLFVCTRGTPGGKVSAADLLPLPSPLSLGRGLRGEP
jgi:hypothetical protein